MNADTKLWLALLTAGRCQFPACNRFLYRHHATGLAGNFAEIAHIIAFSPRGPRGKNAGRPNNINQLTNLMLLCPTCHKHIDSNEDKYSISTLREFKRIHERRVRMLTGATPDNQTSVVKLTAKIRGQAVEISDAEIDEALLPRYTDRTNDSVIDLSQLDENSRGYYEQAKGRIRSELSALYRLRLDGQKIDHVSVFALAPIPILVYLGSQLSTKVRTEFYQRHRATESWTWGRGPGQLKYSLKIHRSGRPKNNVALIISMSGTIHLKDLPQNIVSGHNIYEISLKNRIPGLTVLRRQPDLEAFAEIYRGWLAALSRYHGMTPTVELFAAVPAPVAILCGRERLPDVHPRLKVFENNLNTGFKFALEV